MTDVRLMVAGGTGRLVRRPSVALFDPEGTNNDLAGVFSEAASDDDAVVAVKKHLIDGGFDAAPLIVVRWADDHIDLLVFGDVEAHTSAAAAPMVTGAGSATWVEHHLGAIEMGSATEVELWSGTEVDEATDLQAGAVRVGAFRLALSFDASPAAAESTDGAAAPTSKSPEDNPLTAPTETVAPAPLPSEAPPAPAINPGNQDAIDAPTPPPAPPAASAPSASPFDGPPSAPAMPPTAAAAPAASPFEAPPPAPGPAPATQRPPVSAPPPSRATPPPPGVASPPPPVGQTPSSSPPPPAGARPSGQPSPPPPPGAPALTDDLATVPPISAASSGAAGNGADPFTTESSPAPSLEPPAPLPDFEADPITEAEPDLGDSDQDPATSDLPEAMAGGLVEAAHCPSGHPNPPRTAACYVCAAAMTDDQSLGLIEQPAVGRIMFSSGQGLELATPVKMGRKPDSDDGAHPVVIDHVEVSRTHASIKVEGWTVLLTDEGSRNGTWVTPANDPMPVRLDADVPHVLEDGDTVHLGGPEVAFTYHFDAEPA